MARVTFFTCGNLKAYLKRTFSMLSKLLMNTVEWSLGSKTSRRHLYTSHNCLQNLLKQPTPIQDCRCKAERTKFSMCTVKTLVFPAVSILTKDHHTCGWGQHPGCWEEGSWRNLATAGGHRCHLQRHYGPHLEMQGKYTPSAKFIKPLCTDFLISPKDILISSLSALHR